MIYLLALIATIPVITSFSIGALLSFAWCVTQLLREDHPAGTAEQETERKELAARRATQEQHAAIADSNLPSKTSFEGIRARLQEFNTLLASSGFPFKR